MEIETWAETVKSISCPQSVAQKLKKAESWVWAPKKLVFVESTEKNPIEKWTSIYTTVHRIKALG